MSSVQVLLATVSVRIHAHLIIAKHEEKRRRSVNEAEKRYRKLYRRVTLFTGVVYGKVPTS